MSSLQESTLAQYKNLYPNDKLRNISEKTSIQITRVFRILNGSEMKLTEYEAFQRCLTKENKYEELNKVLKSYLTHASLRSIRKLKMKMEHELELKKIAQMNPVTLPAIEEVL